MSDEGLNETCEERPRLVREPRRFGERFQVESLVGSGGMGMVFRGRDLVGGQAVALKVLHRQGHTATERFAREAEALAALIHPAIVRYVAHGATPQGEPYLAMEWLDGETLEDRLARGPIGPAAAARLGRRVLQALSVAHARGIVHRDIKPSNLFLPAADLDQVKLLDFGIAHRAQDDWQVTRSGTALGTSLYMAPEQAGDGQEIDGRADIFSLGCVLFECATGEPLRLHVNDASGTHAWDAADLCSAVPQPLRAVLDRMLALEVAERSDDAEKLSAELASVAETLAATGQGSQRIHQNKTLSGNEQRVAAVVVVSGISPESGVGQGEARETALQELLAAYGGQAVRTVDGLTTITFTGLGIPADQAAQAARLALRLKGAFPESSVGLSTSRTDTVGEAIGKAARLLSSTPTGTIHVDAPTAHLLETRFELQALTGGASRLLFEKGIREVPCTLMGQEIPCFGREREIGLLETLWDEACDEPAARVLLLTAAAGGGKSRVRHEFCERLQRRGRPFELLVGRGDPMRDAAPFALLGPALLAAAGITGGEPEAVQRKRLTAHVCRFLPEKDGLLTAAFLGEMANLPFPDDDLLPLRAARKDARLMADQKLMAWLEWLEAECNHHPVLLVLEDLHWGDAPSVNLVDAALRVLTEKPLMVLALARPEVDRRFPAIWQARNPQRINLAPLSPRWSQTMVEHVVGKIPETSARWIVERAQGNPFYLQELLRVVADGGRVGDDSNLPDTVLGMVQTRFDGFGPEAKLVLRAGSVFGQVFRPAGVKALLNVDRRKDVDRWLEILEKQEILFSRSTNHLREYVFRHALLRQAAYEMLPPVERRLGHLLAGQYLEQTGEREGIVLADHFERAGEDARAVPWLRVAANQAMEADDLKAALERVERGVRLGAQGDDLAELCVIEAEARFWKGEYVEAERAAREARKCEAPKLALRAMSALIEALGPQAKYEEIGQLAVDLQQRPAQPELLNAWLHCKHYSAAYLASAGRFELRERILALLEAERDNLDPILVGRIESMKAHVARDEDRPADSAAGFKRAWEYFESVGHRRAGTEALGNAGVAFAELGQLEQAEEQIRKLWAIAERMGLKHLLGGTLYMLSNILAYQGRLDEARVFGERAIKWTTDNNDQYFGSCARLYMSVIEHLSKDYLAAEGHARQVMEMLANNPGVFPFALAMLARSLHGQGKIAEALSCACDAYAQLEARGQVQDGEMVIRLAFAECLVASSDLATAKQVLAKATERLGKQASNIDNPEWRQSFLTCIPEHRRILELAHELGLATFDTSPHPSRS